MAKGKVVQKEPLDWLMEPDDHGSRYLALRDLLKAEGKELAQESRKAHTEGPIAEVLSKMDKEGFWVKEGPGYNPKYFGTVWSIILLAQLGASPAIDKRVMTACSYILEHNLTRDGMFSINGLPSGTVDCLQGNLCASLLDLGCEDPRLDKAFEWMARSVTGEGVAPQSDKKALLHYYAYKCGPNFMCGANDKKPCAWGGTKVMLAFSKLPKKKRTPLVEKAIKAGTDFFLSKDPAKVEYPSGYAAKPSGNWWKFGFPVFYITDILQIAEGLTGLGYGDEPRLANTLKLIREKQDEQGRWPLEYDYTGKTWADFGRKKLPNKWVTLRALRVLRKVSND
jgi:hypothetical protein